MVLSLPVFEDPEPNLMPRFRGGGIPEDEKHEKELEAKGILSSTEAPGDKETSQETLPHEEVAQPELKVNCETESLTNTSTTSHSTAITHANDENSCSNEETVSVEDMRYDSLQDSLDRSVGKQTFNGALPREKGY
jgi:hypothetical protein